MSLASPPSVDLTSVFDPQHDDLLSVIVDAIEHSIRATSCTVHAGQFVAQGSSDALGVLDERSRDEVDRHGGDRCGQFFGECSSGRASDDEFVRPVGHQADAEISDPQPNGSSEQTQLEFEFVSEGEAVLPDLGDRWLRLTRDVHPVVHHADKIHPPQLIEGEGAHVVVRRHQPEPG